MSELLVCEGASLKLSIKTGKVSIQPATSVLSQKVKTNGNKVYKKIGFKITNASVGACTQSKEYTGVLKPKGDRKVLIDDGEKPIIESDTTMVEDIKGQTQQGASCPIKTTVSIDDPGQQVARVAG